MKITSIDRATHRQLSSEIATTLAALGTKYGVTFEEFGGQYGMEAFFKIKATVVDTGAGLSSAEALFRRHAAWSGIDPDAFGKTFVFRGDVCTVTGWRPSAPKYPVIGTCKGKTFYFMTDTLTKKYPRPIVVAA